MFTFFEARNRRAGRTATSKLLAIVNHKVGNALFNDAKNFLGYRRSESSMPLL